MTKTNAKMVGQLKHKTHNMKVNIYDDGTFCFKGVEILGSKKGGKILVHGFSSKLSFTFDLQDKHLLQTIIRTLLSTNEFDFFINDEKYKREKTIKQLKKMILETKLLIKNSNNLK